MLAITVAVLENGNIGCIDRLAVFNWAIIEKKIEMYKYYGPWSFCSLRNIAFIDSSYLNV